MTNTKTTNQTRLLRWRDVQPRVGICRSQAHALIQHGNFPAPVKLGKRASAWIETEIDQWIESRITTSRNQKGGAA
jgi:prophage regulatory protein